MARRLNRSNRIVILSRAISIFTRTIFASTRCYLELSLKLRYICIYISLSFTRTIFAGKGETRRRRERDSKLLSFLASRAISFQLLHAQFSRSRSQLALSLTHAQNARNYLEQSTILSPLLSTVIFFLSVYLLPTSIII